MVQQDVQVQQVESVKTTLVALLVLGEAGVMYQAVLRLMVLQDVLQPEVTIVQQSTLVQLGLGQVGVMYLVVVRLQ